jgi:hypothetical protein
MNTPLPADERGEGFAFFRWTVLMQAKERDRCWTPGWACFPCRADWGRLR